MVSRRDIREAFYSDLETAASPHLDPVDITQEYPDTTEELPTIVHRDDYRKRLLNRGQGPSDVVRNEQGYITALVYPRPMEAVFTLLVLDDDESVKEDIYESVREHFEAYETPAKQASDLHKGCDAVSIEDSTSNDLEDRDPPARGDSVRVIVGYVREVVRDVDPVESVEHAIEQDNYTTT